MRIILKCFFVTPGYVLDSLPSTCENWKSIDEQLSVLKKLEYAPDVVINLRVKHTQIFIVLDNFWYFIRYQMLIC